MNRLSSVAITLVLLNAPRQTNANCGDNGPISTFTGECNYANFEGGLAQGCDIDDFSQAEIDELCRYGAPTQFVEIQGTYQRDRRYFNGGGYLVDGDNGAFDSARIQGFHENTDGGKNTIIAFPKYLAYGTVEGEVALEYGAQMDLDNSCDLKTIMCCFTDDSQMTSFEANGDTTTDVCSHDLGDSPESNHIKAGMSFFPGVEDRAHCVGFTWTDNDDELLGNLLYDISFKNSITKGYRAGVPGAPMCGCVEHMPLVGSAMCRTAKRDGDISYKFNKNSQGNITADNTAKIVFDNCEHGDLANQYKANHNDPTTVDLIDAHLLGDVECEDHINEQHFLIRTEYHYRPYAFTPEKDKWSDLVVGEGIFFLPPYRKEEEDTGEEEFRDLVNANCTETDGTWRHCIIRRVCASCESETHRDIYYKRKSPLPPHNEMKLLDMFLNNFTLINNDMYKGDFELYSTYEDALAGTNKWTSCPTRVDHCNKKGFPCGCGPEHLIWGENNRGHYAKHNGFYVELPSAVQG